MQRLGLLLLLISALGAQETPDYGRKSDLIYYRDHGYALTMDVFSPKEPNGAGVIFVVSGGWFSSPKLMRPHRYRPLLEKGFTVFAVIHGSQPKFTIPEIVPQIHRAVRYVRHHAADHGVDPERLALMGTSAGGHLSLLIGMSGREGNAGAMDPVERQPSRVRAVAAFFPPTDFLNFGGEGKNVQDLPIRDQFAAPFDFHQFDFKERKFVRVTDRDAIDAELKIVSPITHVTADDPPTFLIHGDQDKLVPLQQSTRLSKSLEAAGVETKFVVKEGRGHGWRGMVDDYGRVAEWFEKHLQKTAEKSTVK